MERKLEKKVSIQVTVAHDSTSTYPCAADYNPDGIVTILDLV